MDNRRYPETRRLQQQEMVGYLTSIFPNKKAGQRRVV